MSDQASGNGTARQQCGTINPYMLRRATLFSSVVLLLICSLLTGIVTVPASATVVCRMTGQPMAQEAATESAPSAPVAKVRSCCANRKPMFTAAHNRCVAPLMGRMPCCQFRPASARGNAPALTGAIFQPPVAVLATVPVLPVAAGAAAAIPDGFTERLTLPRAPPDGALSPRAPPALA